MSQKVIELVRERIAFTKDCPDACPFIDGRAHEAGLLRIIAVLEKQPEPTSDAVKILCKRYGTSVAKIAADLEAENERLKADIERKNKGLAYAVRFLNPRDCDREFVEQVLKEKSDD